MGVPSIMAIRRPRTITLSTATNEFIIIDNLKSQRLRHFPQPYNPPSYPYRRLAETPWRPTTFTIIITITTTITTMTEKITRLLKINRDKLKVADI
jgi:hypothetical protein